MPSIPTTNRGMEDIGVADFQTVRLSEKKSENEVVYRVSFTTEREAEKWLEEYSKVSRTGWIVLQTYPHTVRSDFRKKYACVFSNKNKKLPEGKSNKNLNCEMTMSLKIKLLTVDTKKKDPLLRGKHPLPGIVTIKGEHNHNVESSSVLRFMKPSTLLRAAFEDQFREGASPAVAIRLHESVLLAQENGRELLADSHFLPHPQTVYWWHRVWRELHIGPLNDPLIAIKQKIGLYKQKGVIVQVRDESPWAVFVATPVMIRAQAYFTSKSIIFVDTSASCDSTHCNVTLMLTGTKAGAVPIGVLLHEAQTTESYQSAFELFNATFPNAFGGASHPSMFMADNSSAEKGAIANVWPESLQMLCGFHIQYAASVEVLEESIEDLKTLSPDYFEKRVSGLLENKREWVQLFRADLPMGGHHTNNFAEATVRVLKDVILERTKAFNASALVEYISDAWETYLQTRLSRFAYRRDNRATLIYNDLLSRMPPEMAEKIVVIDEDTYHVPSAQTGEPTYEVTVSVGVCDCKAGAAGAFCKHQALVHEKFGRMFPNQPIITSADCYLIGQLAFGNECPKKSFFLGKKEKLEYFEKDLVQLENAAATFSEALKCSPRFPTMEVEIQERPDSPEAVLDEDIDGDEVFKNFVDKWKSIYNLGIESNKKGFLKQMQKTTKQMGNCKNHNSAYDALMRTTAAFSYQKARFGVEIGVNNPAIQRRAPGKSKGRKRLSAGRPLQNKKQVKPVLTQGCTKSKVGRPQKVEKRTKKKRCHVLSQSVNAGVPHIKKH
ncbi:Pre-mRNA-splicing factor SYF1 [Frankliniella fusca]|uniref:Pre-mRNA-splicing factor SYF1 n=1 Tax=Frankliniella fusca TaxID=407009 RepID=A0AAE1LC45_9NEOP|nr:Pre-mRNA-splicing factor SYF1 [Frankliniella fusca]